MKEVSNRAVMALLIATIVISLGGTFISLTTINNRLVGLGLTPITGLVMAPNATATLTVTTTSSIKFSQATVAFGSGYVNSSGGYTACILSTLATGENIGCEDFNEVGNGFTIENDGNTNLTVELKSNVTAATFIGGSTSRFNWNVTLNESGSCVNISANGGGAIFPNTTNSSDCGDGNMSADAGACGGIFEEVSTDYKVICPRLLYDNDNDALNVDVNITIPVDAPAGDKLAGLTVRGTRDPLT